MGKQSIYIIIYINTNCGSKISSYNIYFFSELEVNKRLYIATLYLNNQIN